MMFDPREMLIIRRKFEIDGGLAEVYISIDNE
jgi:hypothetical protein